MSGILDNKTRVLDTILTLEGKEQLARGALSLKYYSFTDGHAFYEADAVSGSTDASQRIYFESNNLPYDKITPTSDDSGIMDTFISAAGKIVTGSVHDSETISGISLIDTSTTQVLNKASIDSLQKQQIIGTYDSLFEQDTFGVNFNNIQFVVRNETPVSVNNYDININSHPSVFNDLHLSHLTNLKYLPPITSSVDGKTGNLGYYPPYPNFSSDTSFENVTAGSVQTAESMQNFRVISFDPTSNDNTLFCQMFELSGSNGKSSVNKLFAIDAGLQTLNGHSTPSHVFYLGKLLMDDQGTETFFRIFTLLFE
jgi:hypothetical protein